MLRQAFKVAAGMAPAALVAGLGLPALGALVFLTALVLGAACWVISSADRTDRVSQILLAQRGNASRPALDTNSPPSPPAPRPRRRFRPGRS